jgi:hypothetical protein
LRLGLRRRTAILDGFAKSVTIAVAAVSGLILNACGQQQESVHRAPQPAPVQARLFSPQSFWNAPLKADAAIDPRSGPMVNGLVNEVQSELARHYGPWINTKEYSVPVFTVGPNQPTVHVTLNRNLPEMQQAITAVPIPPGAKPAAGSDKNMVIWQPAADTMWEFWRMRSSAGRWHAGAAGAMHHVSTNPGYYTAKSWKGAQRWWGATATGLPLLGGLMTIRELLRGRIDHALAMAIPDSRRGVWSRPATHGDGNSNRPNSLPEGARLRLSPQLDLKDLNLPPMTRMMAEAAQRYGIVVRDRAGVVAFYGQDPTPTGRNPYRRLFKHRYPAELLAGFPWNRLQVLKLHLHGPGG